MMMMSWVCVRGVMVMMVVRRVRDQARVRKWIGWEAKHVEGTRTIIDGLVVVMVVMMWMVVMVMYRVTRL